MLKYKPYVVHNNIGFELDDEDNCDNPRVIGFRRFSGKEAHHNFWNFIGNFLSHKNDTDREI